MTNYPGPTLEAWVKNVYPPEHWAKMITELEPARRYVEDVVLPGFDPKKESWQEYRDWYSAFVEHTAEQRRLAG